MQQVSIKESYDQFKPESVVFVITMDENGKPAGMVAGWNMKCSIDPPMFAVPISKKYNTHKLIRKSKEFVIAVANKSLENEVRFFGSTHGNEVDKNETLHSKLTRYLNGILILQCASRCGE